MKKISLLFWFFSSYLILKAQSFTNEISFRLTSYNNILIPVILNERDTTQLMLHTGSDYISLMEKKLPQLKSIIIHDSIHAIKSWAGVSDQAISLNNHVKLGEQNFNQIPIFIDQQSGHESDGKIGLKFFENKCIEIDFESNKIRVYNKLPHHAESYHQLEARYENQTLFFKAFPVIPNEVVETEFMMHTGYSGAIIFSDHYVKTNHLLEIFKFQGETKLSDAADHTIIFKKSILPHFFIGQTELKDVPISYFDGEVKIQQVNIFGGDLIKRFNWIISADLKSIYLKPNKYYKNDYFKL